MRHPAIRRKSRTPRPSLWRRPARVPVSDFRPPTSDFVLSPPSRLLLSNTYFERPPAFTLIELLVVISIIAVLMGLAFPVMSGVMDRTKKVQAKNDLVQIVNAVNAFYTEYGRYPVLSTLGTDGTYDGTNNDQLFNILRGSADSGEQLTLNPRRIAFINPPVAKDVNSPKGGLGQSGSFAGKYYDPWGTAYFVRLDTSYSNWISTSPPYTNAPSWNGINAGAIAWSYGKNAKLGADDGSNDALSTKFDDVLSWQ